MSFSTFTSFTFSNLCKFHAVIDLIAGTSILWNVDGAAKAIHGENAAKKLFGDKNDQNKVAVRVSESLVGLLLVDVSILLGILSTSTEKSIQKLTCRAAIGIHALMITWRYVFQTRVEAVRKEITSQIIGDVLMASTWIAYLLKNRE